MRARGHGPKDKDCPPRALAYTPANGCPYLTNGTCHAGSIVKDDYACGSGCGLCAPLASLSLLPSSSSSLGPAAAGSGSGDGCRRPCGSWTLKLRGTGGKFIRENVMLSLFEKRAVSQSEGDTLGHDGTAAHLAEAARLGSARVVVLRHPVTRVFSRYWFEGRWDQSARGARTDANARSLETWLEKIRGRAHGTRVWSCAENYYVKTLAACGGPQSGCSVGDGQVVGRRELDLAKASLRGDFTLVLLTEWLGTEGQARLMARELCFEWPRPVQRVPRGISRGEARPIPDLTPKRYSGKGIPPGWLEAGVAPAVLAQLRAANALDLELYQWATELVRERVRRAAGQAAAQTLPSLAVE